jgi:nitrogen fixation protein FixH
MSDFEPKGRPLTGRKVLIIAVSAFGVVIAANMALLFSATGSFPGLVVKNSYVASQGWDARTAAQRALGWEAAVAYGDGAVRVRLSDAEGRAVEGVALEATIGRPATDAHDRTLALRPVGGLYEAPIALEPGLWRVSLATTGAGAPDYEAAADLVVRERK